MTTLSPSGRSFFGVGVAAVFAAGFEGRVGLALAAVAMDGSS
jgi:deoxycytidine triphosphate deaminase